MTITTVIFIISACLVIFAYDAYALYRSRDTEYTISFVIATAAKRNPIIPLAFGILMGHFFWSQCIK